MADAIEVIPFKDLIERANLNTPVFRVAGVSPPEPKVSPASPVSPTGKTPASTEIPFSELGISEPTGEIPFNQITNLDSFPRRTAQELTADKTFNPVNYYAENPGLAKDPAQLSKLLEAYRQRRAEGITTSVVKEAGKAVVPTVKKLGAGIYQLASGAFQLTGLQALANTALGAFETPQVRAELLKESGRQVVKSGAEIAAGTETAATGLTDLARTGFRKLQEAPKIVSAPFGIIGAAAALTGKPLKEKNDQELLQDLAADVEFQKQLKEVGRGAGESLKFAGLDADFLAKEGIHLEPDIIENLSLVDPITMVAFGGGFKLLGAAGKTLATVPTIAKGAELVEKLGAVIPKIIGGAVTKVGQAIPTAVTAGTIAAGAIKGGVFGLSTGLLAAERIAPRVAKIAAGVENVGQQIAGNVQRSAALQNIIDLATSPIITSPIKGAVAGTAAAVPLAAAAEGNEQAGAILGGGFALGTVAGGIHGAKTQIGEFAATRLFDPHTVKFSPIDSPGYGVNPELDRAYAEQLPKLSVNERGAITTFREAIRPLGGELYVLDGPTFQQKTLEALARDKGSALTPEEIAKYQGAIDAQGYFDNSAGGRKVVLLNGDNKAIPHETGHLFDALLSPEKRTEIETSVRQFYTPEQISGFKTRYEQRLGKPITESQAIDELVAENFSAIFNNVPVTELTAPRGFLQKLAAVVGEGAETLGIDLTSGRTTPDLAAPVSFGLRRIFENAAREVAETQSAPGLPTPGAKPPPIPPAAPPAAPGAPPTAPAPPTARPAVPTTPARNIRVTKEQQDAFAKRAEETGITEAKALAAKSNTPEITQRVNSVSDLMQSGNPVIEIEHRGIVSEGAPKAIAGRTQRRTEQAAGYDELEQLRVENRANAPESIVNAHQKTFVPVRWTAQGGTPTLIAMSLDKVISNVHEIVRMATEKGAESLIPYEVQNGKLTETGWNQVIKDAQAYTENQSNGFRGDGQRLTRPTEDVGLSIPGENREYRPQLLDEKVANFQNLIQGLATPETAREIRGKIPGNIKGQKLAEVNLREVEIPAVIKRKNVGKQEFKFFPGKRLQEVNPLRNELARRGVEVRDLIEVTERIKAEDIANVTARPDLQFKAPVTDIIRGGFLPAEEKKAPVPSEDIRNLAKDYSESAGIKYTPAQKYSEVNPDLAKKLADFYESAPNSPSDPAVQRSYKALADETLAQYEALTRAGYKLETFAGDGEPYKSSADAIADIRDNKHLFVLPTEENFAGARDNHMLAESGVPGLPTVNDVFRGIHDFFGHGKEGYSFGPRGEFNAWRAHSEMYSPEAQGALAAETLAQNSWVNFGKHLRDESGNIPTKGNPGYRELSQRPFAEQKNIIIPPELIAEAKQVLAPGGFLPAKIASELNAIKSGQKNGETFNFDGTIFNPGDRKLDVVTLASENIPTAELTPQKLTDFLAKYPNAEKNPDLKPGVFKLADGKTVSLDLNVLVDQSHRENTKKFAADNQQQAIFDLAKFENVNTGGSGETVLKSPADIVSAAEKLVGGESVQVSTARPKNFDEYVGQIASADTTQFKELSKQWGGGFTGEAWRVGQEVKSPAEVATLKRLQTEQEVAGREALKTGDFDTASPHVFKSQFFREAWEAATGEGSAGSALRRQDPNYKPPFPIEEEKQFLPRTEKGKKLSESGFDFRISGQKGARGVTVLKDGISIGEVTSKQSSPTEADISLANLSKQERGKGVGEAAYRELLSQLKDDGVTEISGTIVAPEPLAIRRKIFGGNFKKLERNVEPVSIDEALASANELRRGTPDLIHIEATNEIRPETQFLPRKKTKAFEIPEYLKTPEQDKISSMSAAFIQQDGTTPQFWLNSKSGKILLAPDGHVEAASKVVKERPNQFEETAEVYDAMDNAGWIRGVNQGSTPGEVIYLDGSEKLSRAAKQTMEDIAFSSEREVRLNNEVLIEKPIPPEIEFLPKKKLEKLPDYLDTPEQGKINSSLKALIFQFGVTREFWLNSKTGKILLAEHGHEPAASEKILTDWKPKGEDILLEVYDEMDDRGWLRGIRERPGTIDLNGSSQLSRAATQTMEDIAFSSGREIRLNDETLIEKPTPPEIKFLPKSKRDVELEQKARAASAKRQSEVEATDYSKYEVPAEPAPTNEKPVNVGDLQEPLTVYHFGSPGIEITEPGRMKQTVHSFWGEIPKTFFFVEGSENAPGTQFAGRTAYRAVVDKSKLYDATESDPLEFFRPNRSEADAAVREAGYQGVLIPIKGGKKVVVMYDPVKVEPAGETTTKGTFAPSEGKFLPKEPEQTFKGFEPLSAEKRAKELTRRKIARTRESNPEAILPRYARDEEGEMILTLEGKPRPVGQEYDLMNTPLAREAAKGLRGPEREGAIAEAIGGELVKAYKTAVKNPEIEAGSKWYSTARVRLKKLFGDDSKFFAELLGATSARTPVETNFRFALDAYNRFKQGEYDDILAKYREGKQTFDAGDIRDFVKATKNEDPTRGQFLDWWVDTHDLAPRQSNAKKFGANSRAVLRVLDGSWQSEVKGPKTPNFAGNLTGQTFEATVDVWAARALHRLANLGNDKRWRILPENETGVSDADFYLGQAAYRHAAEKLGVKPDALQAVLWFTEKKHWEDRGWTRGAGATRSDFNTLLAETEKAPEGIFRKKQPQKELAFLPVEGEIKAKTR